MTNEEILKLLSEIKAEIKEVRDCINILAYAFNISFLENGKNNKFVSSHLKPEDIERIKENWKEIKNYNSPIFV